MAAATASETAQPPANLRGDGALTSMRASTKGTNRMPDWWVARDSPRRAPVTQSLRRPFSPHEIQAAMTNAAARIFGQAFAVMCRKNTLAPRSQMRRGRSEGMKVRATWSMQAEATAQNTWNDSSGPANLQIGMKAAPKKGGR